MVPISYDFRPQGVQDEESATIAALIAAQRSRGLQRLQNPLATATPIPPSGDALTRGIVPVIGGQTDAARMQDMMQQRNYEASTVPYLSGQTSEERFRAQLAGDVTGDTRQILRSLVHQNPNDISISPQAYISQTGEGKLDLSASTKDTLDRNIHNDPTFQRLLQKNPDQAKFVYHQLVRRNYDEDVKGAQTYAQSRAQFAQGLIDDNIKEQIKQGRAPQEAAERYYDTQRSAGATYDPVAKTWKVWNMEEPPANQLTGSTAPQRKFVNANDEQNAMMMAGHQTKGFVGLPSVPDVSLKNPALLQQASEYEKDPTSQAAIQAARLAVGRELTPAEKTLAVLKQKQNQAKYNGGPLHTLEDETRGPGVTTRSTLESFANAIMGTSNVPNPDGTINHWYDSHTGEYDRSNWMGKMLIDMFGGNKYDITPTEARRKILDSRGIPLNKIKNTYQGDAASDAAHILSLIGR